MTVFGDAEPEDEYDAEDPVPVRLAVIVKIIKAAEKMDARTAMRIVLVVRLLQAIAAEVGDGE